MIESGGERVLGEGQEEGQKRGWSTNILASGEGKPQRVKDESVKKGGGKGA